MENLNQNTYSSRLTEKLTNPPTDIKHEYLRSRASTCVSLSSPSSHLLAIYRLSRYSCLYLGSLHPRIFIITFLCQKGVRFNVISFVGGLMSKNFAQMALQLLSTSKESGIKTQCSSTLPKRRLCGIPWSKLR